MDNTEIKILELPKILDRRGNLSFVEQRQMCIRDSIGSMMYREELNGEGMLIGKMMNL